MPFDYLIPLIDPTAPPPASWPGGAWGAFLLFLIWGGAGIPMGVIMGRDAGLSPTMMTGMYFVSDIVMAVTHEPLFWLLGWLASIVPSIAGIRDLFRKASQAAGLQDKGAHGPLGLILFSFTVDPISGRGAAAAAGHGFMMGWTFAIAGDMTYFGVLMAATLWLSGVLGDDRVTIGVVLLSIWVLSMLIRRRRQQAAPVPALATVRADDGVATDPLGRRAPRKKAGRKRRPR